MKNIKSINEFLNEDIDKFDFDHDFSEEELNQLEDDVKDITIEITKDDMDEYSVNYQIDNIEIEGKLISYNSGRAKEYKFEPSFIDDETEEYYDENWEDIEEEILAYFWENKKEIDSK
jgi:hypothetical protein